MSIGSWIALLVCVAVVGIIAFNITATLMWAGRRFRNWRLDGYPRVHWGIRESAGGIILTLVMIVLILLAAAL